MARGADPVPGLAGADLLARISAERDKAGLAFNDLVASGEVKAPIVIGRDHLDCGSVASPNRETERDEGRIRRGGRLADPECAAEHGKRRDLGHRFTTAAASAWGIRMHAGKVIVADGTEAAARRMERVFWNDPGIGVMRHADAGYDIAIDCAREQGLDLPMVGDH